MLGFVALVGLTSLLAPRVAQGSILFGVTVGPGFLAGDQARSVSRRYTLEVAFMTLVAALVIATDPAPLGSAPILLAQTLGATLAFVRAHRAVAPFAVIPAAIREADLGPRPGLPGGWLAQVGPFLLLAAAALYVASRYDAIPARFPTHWNLAGKANGWTAKSATSVYRAVALGVVGCAASLLQSWAVLRQTRLPRVTGVEGAVARQVRRILLWATLVQEYIVAILVGWATVLAMFSTDPAMLRLPLVIRLSPFVLTLGGMAVVVGLRRAARAMVPPVGDATPDAHWILGLLYVNRKDPALFVEKRLGLGYTLNLGHPWSWLMMMTFVAAMATAAFL